MKKKKPVENGKLNIIPENIICNHENDIYLSDFVSDKDYGDFFNVGNISIPEEDELKQSLKFINSNSKTTSQQSNNFSKDNYSGLKLFEMDYEKLPTLIDPIFPKVGLVSLVGSSDTGKSTFLRQMALSIALGLKDFVGYKINPSTSNVIYISTEDDPASISISIKKTLKRILENHNIDKANLNRLKFVFDVDLSEKSDKNLIKILNKDLTTIGADLIIIDAFTDIFSGDLNSSTKVREFLNLFSNLAKKYNCLILFLHHIGKYSDKYIASKNNALGSQAFEAKMRVLLELKLHQSDEMKRTLTITKGNYISTEIKKYTKLLDFEEDDLYFIDYGKTILTTALNYSKRNINKNAINPIIIELLEKKMSDRKIALEINNRGLKIGKSTVNKIRNQLKQNS